MGPRRAATAALFFGLALGSAATPALAAPLAPHAAPVWTMDKPASRLGFRAAIAGKPFDGVFKRWDAQLAFDPANLAASRLQVVVQMGSALTGDPARDALLPSPAWLAAQRFPQAVFTSRAFAVDGPGRYVVSGAITVHGVSRPLQMHVHVDAAHDRLTLSGGFSLDRHAFGVGPEGGDAASAAVQVQARLAARRVR